MLMSREGFRQGKGGGWWGQCGEEEERIPGREGQPTWDKQRAGVGLG